MCDATDPPQACDAGILVPLPSDAPPQDWMCVRQLSNVINMSQTRRVELWEGPTGELGLRYAVEPLFGGTWTHLRTIFLHDGQRTAFDHVAPEGVITSFTRISLQLPGAAQWSFFVGDAEMSINGTLTDDWSLGVVPGEERLFAIAYQQQNGSAVRLARVEGPPQFWGEDGEAIMDGQPYQEGRNGKGVHFTWMVTSVPLVDIPAPPERKLGAVGCLASSA